jgi:hypothetical protein
VGNVRIDYYVVINGRGYWRPSKKLRKLGFKDVVCGPDGPAAWAVAQRCNRRVDEAEQRGIPDPSPRRSPETAEAARRYPIGSVGDGFVRYIKTEEWKKKAPSTRTKIWWPAWYRIRDMWADVAPDTILFEQMSEWRLMLVATHGEDAAHKTLKVWRALHKVLRAMKIARDADPSVAVINRAPQPRNERWSEGEVVRIVKGAIRNGYQGLACIVAIAWDSSFSPADVRGLRKRHMKRLKTGTIFDLSVEGRQKTGRPAIGTVTKRTQTLIEAYLSSAGFEMHDEALLFRTRSGAPYRDATLSHDFAALRKLLFPGDSRLLMDMRRSGAVEAIAGEAKPTTLSAKLANSIERSNALHKIYVPVDLAAVRSADDARVRGRRRMRQQD